MLKTKQKIKTRKAAKKRYNTEDTGVNAPLVEALEKFYREPMVQFHIPGHTGGKAAYSPFKKLVGNRALLLDTTDEFDNLGTLHPATGPIKEARELAAQAFGAKKTFFLVGGSTIGNLSLAMGLTKKGQKIIFCGHDGCYGISETRRKPCGDNAVFGKQESFGTLAFQRNRRTHRSRTVYF